MATRFPTLVMDASPMRPEFASGPFFFRTASALPPDRIARLRAAGPEDLERLFAAEPPAAIFGGVHAGRWRAPMDAALIAYAERHGYALVLRERMDGRPRRPPLRAARDNRGARGRSRSALARGRPG